jgi:hypothetical protein
VINWPENIKPINIDFRLVRKEERSETPIGGDETVVRSPYSKLVLTAEFKPLRAGVAGGWAAVSAILRADDDKIRFPFRIPGRARGTSLLQATGVNNVLTITQRVSGAPSAPLVNAGQGFKSGQPISLTHNGENFVYFALADQVGNTVTLTSRLRGGTIAATVPIEYDPPYVVAELDADSKSIKWDEANFFNWTLQLRETK